MAKYIKKFTNHTGYETFINGSDVVLPVVSHCVQEKDVHYNGILQPMVCVLSVQDWQLEDGAKLYNPSDITATTFFKKIEIDGVEASLESLDTNLGRYNFSTTGNYTIRYYFDGVISIPDSAFNGVRFKNITIPNSVSSIGQYAFADNQYLETVTLSNNSITIGNSAFCEDSLDTASTNTLTAINPNVLISCGAD